MQNIDYAAVQHAVRPDRDLPQNEWARPPMRVLNWSLAEYGTAVLCGPRYTGKQTILDLVAEPSVTRVNLAWHAARQEKWRERELLTLREGRAQRELAVLDCVEAVLDAPDLVNELKEALGAKRYLFVSNVPRAMLSLAKIWEGPPETVLELKYSSCWTGSAPLGVLASKVDDWDPKGLRGAINDHPYLGRLLLEAILIGEVDPNVDPVKEWRTLAATVCRPFFQERGQEIRSTPSLLRACRELFLGSRDRGGPGVKWRPEIEASAGYFRLAEWGIVGLDESAKIVVPGSDVMTEWLRFTFAANLP